MYMHVDMDAFFVSCETASRPYLKERPVVVATGHPKKGVVASASYKARKFGIKSGMPLYIAKSILPDVYIIQGNITKYAAISEDVMNTLKKFAKDVEVASIDEAFMDITYYKNDPILLAKTIKKEIKRLYKLPLTIGIGPSKVVAKVICKKSKPDGIGMVKKEEVIDFMGSIGVQEIPGIGKKSAEILTKNGISTGRDLQNADTEYLQKLFGIRGIWFKRLAMGKDAGYFLTPYKDIIKSIGHSETLPYPTRDKEILMSYLLYLSIKVSKRAYRLKKMGRGISLHLRFSDFSSINKQKQISTYLYRYEDIYMAAKWLFNHIPIKKPIRLVGVTIHNLIPLDTHAELFSNKSTSDLLYNIYQKYGDFSVMPLSLLNINKLPKSIPPKVR